MTFLQFPDGFKWGVATAAYQIEGAIAEDYRGLSIWDTFTHQPGRIQNDENGDIACDHYHRYPEDIALAAGVGIQVYRFSIAWSRIYPFGGSAVNEKGLEFYDRVINELLDKGIEPAVTLYHWDLPQWLQDLGGWANRGVVEHFATYAKTLFDRYGDRVKQWMTMNEPVVFTEMGHRTGVMAPGIRDNAIFTRAVHHALLAHGRAVQVFRDGGYPGTIGITQSDTNYEPADDSAETAAAVERARDFGMRLYHGPLYGRGYPDSVVRYYADRGAQFPIEPGDMEAIAAPLDFMGIQLYSRGLIQAAPGRSVGFAYAAPRLPLLPMGYEAAPHALGAFVKFYSKEYGNPTIYITENGVCDNTEPDANGDINDTTRIDLLGKFLAGLHGAIQEGCDVRGYYQWTLMDNFEWAFGFSKRFGIIHTNFETLKRTPKKSAAWYADVIRRNGVEA